jgi:uncharacterized damage-inducible protein DinB
VTETARIAEELRFAFEGEAWHGDGLLQILHGVTAAQAEAHPIAGAHSIWELVLHIAAWDGAVRKRMNGVVVELAGDDNFPPVIDKSETAWLDALEHVRRVHSELIGAVEKFTDSQLVGPVPGKQAAHYSFSYMLHGLAQHVAYHGGQIALLKKM